MSDHAPQPCHHKRADHQHGTKAAYTLDGCRCGPCREAALAYARNRRRQRAYGRPAYIDAEPARAHARALMAAGMGPKRIAAVSGVPHGSVSKLIYGEYTRGMPPSRRIRPATADKLLAVRPDLADGAVIDGTSAVRRLQALVALGWSMSALSERLGKDLRNFQPVIHGRRDVTAVTDRAVRGLYDELSMSLPPETTGYQRASIARVRAYARRRGWAPPLAYDDIDADDVNEAESEPDAYLDEIAIARRMDGDKRVKLTKAERVEIARRWPGTGRPRHEMERITGIKYYRYAPKGDAA